MRAYILKFKFGIVQTNLKVEIINNQKVVDLLSMNLMVEIHDISSSNPRFFLYIVRSVSSAAASLPCSK